MAMRGRLATIHEYIKGSFFLFLEMPLFTFKYHADFLALSKLRVEMCPIL